MALRALASKLRIPAVLRGAPASRSAAPQDRVGNIAPLKPAFGDPLLEMMMEQHSRAFNRRLFLSTIAGPMLGSSAADLGSTAARTTAKEGSLLNPEDWATIEQMAARRRMIFEQNMVRDRMTFERNLAPKDRYWWFLRISELIVNFIALNAGLSVGSRSYKQD